MSNPTLQTNFFIMVESNPDDYTLPEVLKDFDFIHVILPSGSTTKYIFEDLSIKIRKQLSATQFDNKVLFWLFPYFGTDTISLLLTCREESTSSTVSTCENGIKSWAKLAIENFIKIGIPAQKIRGFMVDDEVGKNKLFMLALQNLSGIPFKFTFNQKEVTTMDIQLGWTLTVSKDTTPRWNKKSKTNVCGEPGSKAKPDCLDPDKWTYSLGQAYTDSTEKLYIQNCTPSSSIWSSFVYYDGDDPDDPPILFTDTSNGGKQSPLFCGAGNCQEITLDQKKCIDERLSPETLKDVIKTRPINKFPNCGVWYGTSPFNGMTGFKPDKPDTKVCCMPKGTYGKYGKCDKTKEAKVVLAADCVDCKVKYFNIFSYCLFGLSIIPLIITIMFLRQLGKSPVALRNVLISGFSFCLVIIAAIVLLIAYKNQKCQSRSGKTQFFVYSDKNNNAECDLATKEDGCEKQGSNCFTNMKECCTYHNLYCPQTKEECEGLRAQKNPDGTWGGVFYEHPNATPPDCNCDSISDTVDGIPKVEWICDDKGENCKCKKTLDPVDKCGFAAAPDPLNPGTTQCSTDEKCFRTIKECESCASQLYSGDGKTCPAGTPYGGGSGDSEKEKICKDDLSLYVYTGQECDPSNPVVGKVIKLKEECCDKNGENCVTSYKQTNSVGEWCCDNKGENCKCIPNSTEDLCNYKSAANTKNNKRVCFLNKSSCETNHNLN